MKVILDTNVFASGVFFAGAPYTILDAWRRGRIELVVSPEIMEEYRRVTHDLAVQFPTVDPAPPLELVAVHARIVDAPPLPHQVCTDPDDDKFLACAVASQTLIITTGDQALLRTTGYAGIEVLNPRAFITKYLTA
jgi:putative PIN family toxin of toxin-antitoxin system